jgi:hypothetical protein
MLIYSTRSFVLCLSVTPPARWPARRVSTLIFGLGDVDLITYCSTKHATKLGNL